MSRPDWADEMAAEMVEGQIDSGDRSNAGGSCTVSIDGVEAGWLSSSNGLPKLRRAVAARLREAYERGKDDHG